MILCVYACANCIQNARFKPMHVIEAKLCCHLVFQMSFRNIQRQKCCHNFLDDRSELWPSIECHILSFERGSTRAYTCTYHVGEQQRSWQACASAQSRQGLICSHLWRSFRQKAKEIIVLTDSVCACEEWWIGKHHGASRSYDSSRTGKRWCCIWCATI